MERPVEELQQDFTELLKDFMRRELGKDHYHGKVQSLVVTSNTVTGKVNIDTCNVNLVGDTKKLLREALDQLNRYQLVNALLTLLVLKGRKGGKRNENAL